MSDRDKKKHPFGGRWSLGGKKKLKQWTVQDSSMKASMSLVWKKPRAREIKQKEQPAQLSNNRRGNSKRKTGEKKTIDEKFTSSPSDIQVFYGDYIFLVLKKQ